MTELTSEEVDRLKDRLMIALLAQTTEMLAALVGSLSEIVAAGEGMDTASQVEIENALHIAMAHLKQVVEHYTPPELPS